MLFKIKWLSSLRFLLCLLLALSGTARLSGAVDHPPAAPDPELRPELALQLGHTDHVTAVAYSPDGRWIATAAADHALKLWDARTRDLLWTTRSDDISALAFSPDSVRLASAEWYPAVWDVASGKLLHRNYGLANASASQITFAGGANAVAFTTTGRLTRWALDAAAGKGEWVSVHLGPRRDWSFTGLGYLTSVAGHEGGEYVVTTSHQAQCYVGSGSPREGQPSRQFCLNLAELGASARSCPQNCPDPVPAGEWVAATALSGDTKLLAVADRGGRVGVWDAGRGVRQSRLTSAAGQVATLAWSGRGEYLAFSGGEHSERVEVWDYRNRRFLWRRSFSGRMDALAFSPDGRSLAVGGQEGRVQLYDVQTPQRVRELGGLRGGEPALTVSSRGDWVATVSGADTARLDVWSLKSGELTATRAVFPGAGFCIAASPDGKRLAVGGGAGEQSRGTLRLFHPDTGAPLWNGGAQPGDVRSVAFSPDGKWLASGSYRCLRIWDPLTGRLVRQIDAHAHAITALAFSPGGGLLATASADRSVKLWNTADWSLVRVLTGHTDWITAVAFSPDGVTLASTSWDATTRLWNAATGAAGAVLPGPPHWLLSLAFSPDGATLAVACQDGTVALWDLATRTVRTTLTAHSLDTYSVAFTPDGRRLATLSPETVLKLWSADTGRPVLSLLALRPEASNLGERTTARPIRAESRPIRAESRPIRAESRPIRGDARSGEPGTAGPGSVSSGAAPAYLAMLPGGYYSGSAHGDRLVRFRLGEALFPAECFQAPYYRPTLVRQAMGGELIPPPPALRGGRLPTIRVLSPRPGARIPGGTVRLRLEAADDSRVSEVVVVAAGNRFEAQPVAMNTGRAIPAPSGADRRQFEVTLPTGGTAGPLRIEAVAYDEDGLRSARSTLEVQRAPAAGARGRLLSLCVGISHYVDPRLRLRYAAADARDLAAALRRQSGGKNPVYAGVQASVLADADATRDQVLAGLERLTAQAQPDDTVLLFLAGHGWAAGPRSFYFATEETTQGDLRRTALPWEEVVRRVQTLATRSRRVVVLLDACHSGSATTHRMLARELASVDGGLVVISGSRGDEVSLERPDLRHGLFTHALLEALSYPRPASHSAALPLRKLLDAVQDRVAVQSNGRQHPQVPYLRDFDTDAPLFRVP